MIAALIAALCVLAIMAVGWWRTSAALAIAQNQAKHSQATAEFARAEAERLTAGLDCVGEGLMIVNQQGHVVATNQAAAKFSQFPDQDYLGASLAELVPWPQLREALIRCRSTGLPQTFTMESDDVSGVGELEVCIRILPNLGAAVSIADLSRLKQLESLRRDFVANVSHELKTPLAAIKGFVETVVDDAEMPAAVRTRFLERVSQQTQRLESLVSDLMTLSRLDTDPGAHVAEPCDMVVVLTAAISDLLPISERRDIRLETAFVEGPVWVRAAPEALRLVAGNLIDNALKYTTEQGAVIVTLKRLDERIRLEVADTGLGLSAENQERIFERFYRVDQARSRELGGTGLGLSIVKNTVKNLNGSIGVKSELGVGSMFWVELPT